MRLKIINKYFNKSPQSRIINLALVLTCALPISALLAAEDKPQTEISSNENAKIASPTKKPEARKQPASKVKKAPDFKPSEAISEDFSVLFPVDI